MEDNKQSARRRFIMTNDERIIKKLEKEPYPFNLIFLKMFYMIEENKVSEEDFKISYDRYLNKIPKDEIDFFTEEIENMIMSTSYSDRNKEMCLIRFKEKLSYREIGERFGISGSRVMDITAKGRRSLFSNQRKEFVRLIYKILTLTIPPLLSSAHTKYMIFLKYGHLPYYDELEKYFPDKIVLNQTSWFDDNKYLQKIARRGIRESIDEVIQEFKRQQHEKTYKVCAWTDKQAFISDCHLQMTARQMFAIAKGNSFDEIIPKIVDQIRKEFMVKNVDFKFDKIPCEPDELWDMYYEDAKNDFRISIKDITDEDCRVICIKPIEVR
jgi:transcriptional regulator with XRE-family HTH domain